MTNRRRAYHARSALQSVAYWGDNDPQTDLSDFLCDVRHFCRMEGLDFEKAVEDTELHYREEKERDWDEEE